MKIYYRWCGNIKYEIYIRTGRTREMPDLKTEIEEMVVIYLVGRRVNVNKRRRIWKFLFNPPQNSVIGIGETWCWLSDDEKKHYLELGQNEFNKLLETYDIDKMRFL